MINHVVDAMLDTNEIEVREFARRVAKEAAAEVGAKPEASGVVAHLAAQRAAELAVLKAFGIAETQAATDMLGPIEEFEGVEAIQ